MIEIEDVQPNAHEFRAIKRGWGFLHWALTVPALVGWLGFAVFGLVVLGMAGPIVPPEILPAALVTTYLIWRLSNWMVRKVAASAQRSSPTGGLPWNWRIDADGIVFDNGLQRNQIDWRGVKAVREEPDRVLFLVTPGYNPVLPTRLLTSEQKADLKALIAEARTSGLLKDVN